MEATLEKLFKKYGYKYEMSDFTNEGEVYSARASKDTVSFHILLINKDSGVLAYDLESSFMPRDIYSDDTENGFTAQQRSKEILQNLQLLLDRKVTFHADKSLFNKHRGYIELKVDGKARKIYLKDNSFDFPREG